MLPVYFPFTTVSNRLMNTFSKFFKQVVIYQVSERTIPERMKKWHDEQRIEVRIPFQHYEKEIAALLSEYQTWAQHHQGSDVSFFRAHRDRIPFFSDTSVSQIRKEIKARGDENAAVGKDQLPDLYPEIFLQMAQDLDEKNREITRDLKSQAIREQKLMKDLKGEGSLEPPDDSGRWMVMNDHSEYMIPERIAAWAHFMLSDAMSSPILITSNRKALDDLFEHVPRPEEVVHLQSIAAPAGDSSVVAQHQDNLMTHLENIADLPWEGEGGLVRYACGCKTADPGATLSLYVIPGMMPRELFGRYVKSDTAGDPCGRFQKIKKNNTLLGLVEPLL